MRHGMYVFSYNTNFISIFRFKLFFKHPIASCIKNSWNFRTKIEKQNYVNILTDLGTSFIAVAFLKINWNGTALTFFWPHFLDLDAIYFIVDMFTFKKYVQ